jgi:sugar phosphate isomerase/epimerase
MKLSTTQHNYSRWGKDKYKKLREIGFEALDFNSGLVSGHASCRISNEDFLAGVAEEKKLIDEAGLEVYQMHGPWRWPANDATPEDRANRMSVMQTSIKACAMLGCKNWVIHPIMPFGIRDLEIDKGEETWALNIEFFTELAKTAHEYDVKICIENMWQNHPVSRHICDDVCADPHELATYYDTLNDPDHFTVCLDIGHVALCGREPEDAIRILGHDRLGALHVHDVDYVSDLHQLPGMSKINWNSVLQALADIQYSGEFTLEADSFLHRFDLEYLPTAAKFMADTAKYMADQIEELKAQS